MSTTTSAPARAYLDEPVSRPPLWVSRTALWLIVATTIAGAWAPTSPGR